MKTAARPAPQENTSLTVSKWIKASPARVFRALTSEEEMNRWFTPDLKTRTPDMKASLKVGGAYALNMHRTDGTGASRIFGKYLEIEQDRKLVFTWGFHPTDASCGGGPMEGMPDESIVTITLSAKDGGTELVLTHERLGNAEAVERHREGWQGCLTSLTDYAEAKLSPLEKTGARAGIRASVFISLCSIR